MSGNEGALCETQPGVRPPAPGHLGCQERQQLWLLTLTQPAQSGEEFTRPRTWLFAPPGPPLLCFVI